MSEVLFGLTRLVKSYDGRNVLDIENASFEEGRITGLLGPNGAGKTTLLEILGFLLRPTSGEVRFNGKRVDYEAGGLLDLRRRVVLVQQQPILFSTSVGNNVSFPLKVRKVSKQKRDAITSELLDLVGMRAFSDAKAYKLSGGETQRVAIATALAASPQAILMDEPTSNVDVENRMVIENIIRDINETKKMTVIFTTHDLIQAARLTHETVSLFEGKVADSVVENIVSTTIEVDAEGRHYCKLHDGLTLYVRAKGTGPVRVSVNPNAVRIRTGSVEPASINTFQGKLMQLTDERHHVRALFDVGFPISALIPKTSLSGLSIGIGDVLYLTCPPEGIEIYRV